ncbi:hypothetical protein AAFF_G00255610 [Aldrovandia affinis]|uniref:Uncharacterized protein n=1 Tax=Aldrovandia affinis TaxID=143900 RepID=A0AAD7W333_9TELE|nr:hypothetical protein AAFF_G00255610 [Aldrovandia affinis]
MPKSKTAPETQALRFSRHALTAPSWRNRPHTARCFCAVSEGRSRGGWDAEPVEQIELVTFTTTQQLLHFLARDTASTLGQRPSPLTGDLHMNTGTVSCFTSWQDQHIMNTLGQRPSHPSSPHRPALIMNTGSDVTQGPVTPSSSPRTAIHLSIIRVKTVTCVIH